MTLDLNPCDPEARCTDCDELAEGLRKNAGRQPTCRMCEAERLAMITLILEAAEPEPVVGVQLGLLPGSDKDPGR